MSGMQIFPEGTRAQPSLSLRSPITGHYHPWILQATILGSLHFLKEGKRIKTAKATSD
jgi:hypothetical protein